MKLLLKFKLISTILVVLIFTICSLTANDIYIDGEFNGWYGETVIKLSTGSYWIQSEYFYYYCYWYNPKVELFEQYGSTRIKVQNCSENKVSIKKIDKVYESKIDGDFEGFDENKIFKLTNGTIWKQTEYKYNYKYEYNPKCLIYYYNGSWKLSVKGTTVNVEQVK